jgi:hypothetical protein
MDIVPPPFQPSFICKTFSGGTNSSGKQMLKADLKATWEARLKGE